MLKKVTNSLVISIFVYIMLIALLCCFFNCSQGNKRIIIKKPTELLRYTDPKPRRDNVIMVLGMNDTAKVLDETYTKEYKYYEVDVRNGIRGYILYDHSRIEILDE